MSKQKPRGSKRVLPPASEKKTIPGSKRNMAGTAVLALDPEREYGPEMSRLTDARKLYVIASCMFPTAGQSEWCRMAGFGSTPDSWKATGWQLEQNPVIQAARTEENRHRFGSLGALSLKRLREQLDSKNEKIVQGAIKIVIDGIGLTAPSRHEISVRHQYENMSTEDVVAETIAVIKRNPTIMDQLTEEQRKLFPQIEHKPADTENRIFPENTEDRIIDGEFAVLEAA